MLNLESEFFTGNDVDILKVLKEAKIRRLRVKSTFFGRLILVQKKNDYIILIMEFFDMKEIYITDIFKMKLLGWWSLKHIFNKRCLTSLLEEQASWFWYGRQGTEISNLLNEK